MDPVNVPAKFEVRSFTRYCDWSFGWLGVAKFQSTKECGEEVGNGTIRKKVGDFL